MNKRRLAAGLALAAFMSVVLWVLPLQSAHAQCDPATGADCGSGDKDQEKDKQPTATDVPTSTPTATATMALVPLSGGGEGLPTPIASATPTIDPAVYATARACWDDLYRKTPQPELPTPSWLDIQYDAPQCIPTPAPTKVPPIAVTFVAGPVFVAPGVKNTIIAVLLVGGLLAGAILVARRLRPPNPNKPPSPNKPPTPNK